MRRTLLKMATASSLMLFPLSAFAYLSPAEVFPDIVNRLPVDSLEHNQDPAAPANPPTGNPAGLAPTSNPNSPPPTSPPEKIDHILLQFRDSDNPPNVENVVQKLPGQAAVNIPVTGQAKMAAAQLLNMELPWKTVVVSVFGAVFLFFLVMVTMDFLRKRGSSDSYEN
jgi:hypothetical protein